MNKLSQQARTVLALIEKGEKVVCVNGAYSTIGGKKFPTKAVREATQHRFVQRVIRRNKEAQDALQRTELSSGPASESQATGGDQASGVATDQGSGGAA